MAQSPICPACGCSLVRLGIERSEAPVCEGREILFCRCPHCIDKFRRRPDELFARFVA